VGSSREKTSAVQTFSKFTPAERYEALTFSASAASNSQIARFQRLLLAWPTRPQRVEWELRVSTWCRLLFEDGGNL